MEIREKNKKEIEKCAYTDNMHSVVQTMFMNQQYQYEKEKRISG